MGPQSNTTGVLRWGGDTRDAHKGEKATWELWGDNHPQAKKSSQEKQNLPTPCSETFSLQNCRNINIYHLSHPVGGLCYGSPGKLKQGCSYYLPWALQQGLESGLQKSGGDHFILWGLKAVISHRLVQIESAYWRWLMLEYIFLRHSQIHSLILYKMMWPQRDAYVSGVVGDRGMSSSLGIHGLGMETDTKNTTNCHKSSVYWPEGVKAETKKK